MESAWYDVDRLSILFLREIDKGFKISMGRKEKASAGGFNYQFLFIIRGCRNLGAAAVAYVKNHWHHTWWVTFLWIDVCVKEEF